MYGFTFNGQASSSFMVVMRSKNRQLLPLTRDQYKEIPGMDGSHLFPGALSDRYIGLECAVAGKNLPDLRQQARAIAAWLHTPARAKLIFDDEPGVYYWAKLANQVDLDQAIIMGRFTLQFRCLPYAYSVNSIVVEQELANGETLTLTNGGTAGTPFTVEVNSPAVTGYAAFPALGAGVCPDIALTTLAQGFTLDVNGEGLNYLGAVADTQKVYLDTGLKTAQLDGANALRYHDGAFPELAAGTNTLTYASPNSCAARVKLTYIERWL